ncbi:S8 family serine peptidase, partial [Nanoarchaeota archaeon]
MQKEVRLIIPLFLILLAPSILAFSDVSISANPTTQKAIHGTNGTFILTITNTGVEDAITFDITLNNINTAEVAVLNDSQVTLNSGAQENITLKAGGYDSGLFNINITATHNTNSSVNDSTLVTLNSTGDQYEQDNTEPQANWITPDGTLQTHTFYPANDNDWIKFNATAGDTYIMQTFNITSTDITDTIIDLYTNESVFLGESDDIKLGVTRTSRLGWRCLETATYYVKVSEWGGEENGTYQFSITKLGQLVPELHSPITQTNVTQDEVFSVTTNITCIGGPCYDVTAALDPKKIAQPLRNRDKLQQLLDSEDEVPVIIKFKKQNILQAKVKGAKSISFLSKDRQDSIGLKERKGLKINKRFRTLNLVGAKIDKKVFKELKSNPEIESIEYDRPVHAFLSQSVPFINATHLNSMTVNNSKINGTGETICVIDTGIAYDHADFGSCALVANLSDSNCPKVLGGYDFVNDDWDPDDDHGHGSHVSGIIASEDATYTGVAPGAKLIAIKALDSGGDGSTSDITAGIDWCVAEKDTYNISVISMSLGTDSYHHPSYCDGDNNAFATAINTARGAGILVVVATGNENKGYSTNRPAMSSPSCIKNSTSISSIERAVDSIPTYANRCPFTELLAPG